MKLTQNYFLKDIKVKKPLLGLISFPSAKTVQELRGHVRSRAPSFCLHVLTQSWEGELGFQSQQMTTCPCSQGCSCIPWAPGFAGGTQHPSYSGRESSWTRRGDKPTLAKLTDSWFCAIDVLTVEDPTNSSETMPSNQILRPN